MKAAAPASSPPATVDGSILALYGAVVFAWGLSWIALRAQLGVVAPEVSILWRFMIAAAVMLAWVLARGERMRFPMGDHLRFLAMGVLMFSTNFVLFYYGGVTIPSGLLAVVFSLASIVNLVLGAVWLRQPIEPRVALGGLIGAGGIGLLYYPQIAGQGFDPAALAGLGLCILGTLSFCCGNMVASTLQRRGVPLMPANAWGMVYAVGALALVSIVRGQPLIIEPTVRYLGSLVFLAIISSVVAFAAYVGLLRRIGAARAGYSTVLFPIAALLVSTLVEDYVWTLPAILGAALALAGNLLVLTGRKA